MLGAASKINVSASREEVGEEDVEESDKIAGVGWLSRLESTEVIAVVGLSQRFAGERKCSSSRCIERCL